MITVILTSSEVSEIKPHPTNDKLMVASVKSFNKYVVGGDVKEAFVSMVARFLPFHETNINEADRHTISGTIVYDPALNAQVVNITSLSREFVQ
jgi:hypothetical protein